MKAALLLLALLLAPLPALAGADTNAAASEECKAEAAADMPAPTSPEAPYAAGLRADTEAVYAGAEFHDQATSRQLVMRPWLKEWWEKFRRDDVEETESPTLPEWLAWLAPFLKYATVIALALLLAWLLHTGYRWLAPQIRNRPGTAPSRPLLPVEMHPLSGTPLPTDISAAARAAWQRGERLLALSLLYRGAVTALDRQYGIVLPASATEGECLRRARASHLPVVPEAFSPVVRAWVAAAYGQRLPDDVEPLLALYRQHFETTGSTGGAA